MRTLVFCGRTLAIRIVPKCDWMTSGGCLVVRWVFGRDPRSVFIRYAIVATKDIQNAMNALEKNDGTLMEPDARLAQRLVTGFMNSFVFLELEPRARVELATCRLRIGCSTTELPRPLIIKDLFP